MSIHTAACLSVVVFGVTSVLRGGWQAWATGADFAAAGLLGGGVVVAVCGVVMLVRADEFDSRLGTLTVVGVAVYVVGVVWELV